MLSIEKLVDFEINSTILESILEDLEILREVELIVCDDEYIQNINRDFRGINKATDVLSFPVDGNFEALPLGTIIISKDKALQASREFGHSFEDEFTLLFIHGILHLMGFDHEVDNGQMRQKEQELVKKFNLPASLIVRSE
jgi:probable rRNA maturation factor